MAERKLDLLDADNGDGVEVADGAEPVDAGEDTAESEDEPVKSLTQRMAAMRAEASGIGKEDIKMSYEDKKTNTRKDYTIKGHTIEAVLHGVRSLFDRHGVWMEPNLVERTYNGNRCDVIFDFRFESIDDRDDIKIIRYPGADTDNGGKGCAKAGTNALKEMLKKVFLITDREDAKEETEQTDYRSDEGATRAEVDDAMNQARAALMQWASTFKAAVENAKSLKDIQRLERENRDQLTDEQLPSVTRSFFAELIDKRKKEFKEAPPEEIQE